MDFNFNIKVRKEPKRNYLSDNDIKNCIPVKEYEDRYVIDKIGNVYSIKDRYNNKRIKLMSIVIRNGYKTVMLTNKAGFHKRELIHRLVAKTFIPNPKKFDCVNHKDENKLNNSIDNLEWCTRCYNTNYSKDIIEWNKERGFDIEVYDSLNDRYYTFRSIRECVKVLGVNRFKFTNALNKGEIYNGRYGIYKAKYR